MNGTHCQLNKMQHDLINANPTVYERKTDRAPKVQHSTRDEGQRDPIDAGEIFEHIRDIQDPEHPYSLEQLHVVAEDLINIDDSKGHVRVQFTPTVQHCSMATLIGLSLRVKLLRSLHPRFKVDIAVTPGGHSSEDAVNKQLNDKERVAAALENPNLLGLVEKCLAGSHQPG